MCVSRMGSLKPTLFSNTPTCHTWIKKDPSVGKYMYLLYINTLIYMDAMMLTFFLNPSPQYSSVSKPFFIVAIQQSTVCGCACDGINPGFVGFVE